MQCITIHGTQKQLHLQVEGTSRKCEMIVSVRPYPCQCYNSIRRGRPAGDHEAGLMPVDAKDVRRRIVGLHKWLVGICEPKKQIQSE